MNAAPPITVLLAEDHDIVREGLRKLLEHQGGFDVVGEAATGREAVALTAKLRPDVVVMDIAMPVLNGLEATRQIRRAFPEIKVLILSAHSDEAYIERVAALGAAGYLIKQTSAHVLSEAIQAVHGGASFFCPVTRKPKPNRNSESPAQGRLHKSEQNRLTSREVEVLQLIAEGLANKQVATELGISIKTVEKHRQSVMQKLGIHDTAGLTRHAITTGVIENSVQLKIT